MEQERHRPVMTTEELFALPEDDEVDRELIEGQLYSEPATNQTPCQGQIAATLSHRLGNWLKQQSKPRGRIYSGECAFRIRRRPDTTVGIDVAYINANLAAQVSQDATWIDGVPVLAVEILSPSDRFSKTAKKVREYLEAGVALVWVIDPFLNVVYVHAPQRQPTLVTATEELSADPHLAGLTISVAELFEA